MARPVVGIIGNMNILNDNYAVHAVGTMNSAAVAEVAGCLPLLIPSDPRLVTVGELLETCDGFLLTGGRPNVHPEEYGEPATEAHGAFDRCRDAITLPRRPRRTAPSTVAAMRARCRWCGPVSSVASPSWGSAGGFRK